MDILPIRPGHPLWAQTAAFARGCSWRAGPVLAKQMEENALRDWERVIVAAEDGRPAAFCTLTARDELPEGTPYTPFIGFVFVDEAHRGHRLSERMILEACRYARGLGFGTVYVMSGEKGLYEKFGFERLGTLETVYGTWEQLFAKCLT